VQSSERAAEFIDNCSFVWHQRFELAPEVFTPGVSNVAYLASLAEIPHDLSGQRVLDVGTTNGGAAFECERRGAERIVAVDVLDAEVFGIEELIEFLDSKVVFVQASIYELAATLRETFDLVICWGVLYHLRHPLLALDSIRDLASGLVTIETAVADSELGERAAESLVRFYRLDELGADSSNWFAPTVAALENWVRSSGFEPQAIKAWPEDHPSRAMINAVLAAGQPEYQRVSYERPLRVRPVVRRSTP
jgi:tRNA (mo5U34)-methyltransferase